MTQVDDLAGSVSTSSRTQFARAALQRAYAHCDDAFNAVQSIGRMDQQMELAKALDHMRNAYEDLESDASVAPEIQHAQGPIA